MSVPRFRLNLYLNFASLEAPLASECLRSDQMPSRRDIGDCQAGAVERVNPILRLCKTVGQREHCDAVWFTPEIVAKATGFPVHADQQ